MTLTELSPYARPMRLQSYASITPSKRLIRGVAYLALFTPLLFAQPLRAEERATHVVKLGESLRTVAERYDCSMEELFRANLGRVEHPHLLGVGTRLTIPKCEPAEKVVDLETSTKAASELRPGPQHCAWSPESMERDRLGERLLETVERLPDYFQAIVVETTPTTNGAHIASQRVLVHGSVDRPEAWHPGLSVSLFSAVGALARTSKLGLNGDVELTFHDDGGPVTVTLGELLHRALAKGKAHAHNRLVQLAGTDRLHGDAGLFGGIGLSGTTLVRAFDASSWADLGQPRGLRRAPRIVLAREQKRVALASAVGRALEGCDQEAARPS